MRALKERLSEFLFPTESDAWLSILRVGLGFQITLYSFSLRNDWNSLLAGADSGLVNRDLTEALLSVESRFAPMLGWLAPLRAHAGLREETVLSILWICLLAAGCGLIAGIFSRTFAILAWFLHLAAAKSGGFVAYGLDNFMTIWLFYLMLSPLPGRYALYWRLQKSQPEDSPLLGFWRRVLQIHLCIIYFFS